MKMWPIFFLIAALYHFLLKENFFVFGILSSILQFFQLFWYQSISTFTPSLINFLQFYNIGYLFKINKTPKCFASKLKYHILIKMPKSVYESNFCGFSTRLNFDIYQNKKLGIWMFLGIRNPKIIGFSILWWEILVSLNFFWVLRGIHILNFMFDNCYN